MTNKEIIHSLECCNDEYSERTDCSFSGKEYANQMRENAVIDNNGNIIVSEELWQQIANIIETQQAEIEELNAEIDKQYEQAVADIKGNLANGGVSCHWCIEQTKAEAIRDFAEMFDDVLAGMRDTYFERGLKDYSLVCEVIHNYLYRTLREMVGDKNE